MEVLLVHIFLENINATPLAGSQWRSIAWLVVRSEWIYQEARQILTMASYRFNPTPSGGGSSSANNSLLVTTATTLGASLLITQLLTPADPLGKSLRFLKQLGRQVRAIYTYIIYTNNLMLLHVMIRPTITKKISWKITMHVTHLVRISEVLYYCLIYRRVNCYCWFHHFS